MPHESTVEHEGSELSADELDLPADVALETSSAACLQDLISPLRVPHVPHVRPETPREVTHHHDDDDDDDEEDDNNVDVIMSDVVSPVEISDVAKVVVNGTVNN